MCCVMCAHTRCGVIDDRAHVLLSPLQAWHIDVESPMPATWPPDFWHDAVLHPGHAEALTKWRGMIVSSQNPPECVRTCSLRGSVHIGGAMQNMRRIAHAVMQAALKNCAISNPWPSWIFAHETTSVEMRERCTSERRKSLECYFLPISNCTSDSRGASSSKFQYLDAYMDVSDMLDRVAEQTGLRSELLIMGTLLSWIMRPQRELRAALEQYGAQRGLDLPAARHNYIGMHLRRGDKYSLYSRHLQHNAYRITPSSFAIWGRRVAAQLGMHRVLYMSDDKALNLDPRNESRGLFLQAPTSAMCRPSAHSKFNIGGFEGRHGSSTTVLKSIRLRAATFGPIMRGVVSTTPACISPLFADDGIQLYAGMMMLAHSASFIGTQISNIDMAIVELMATQHFPPSVHDVLNDLTRPFLSDERVWYGSTHHQVRSTTAERLARADGSATHGCWMCDINNTESRLERKLLKNKKKPTEAQAGGHLPHLKVPKEAAIS